MTFFYFFLPLVESGSYFYSSSHLHLATLLEFRTRGIPISLSSSPDTLAASKILFFTNQEDTNRLERTYQKSRWKMDKNIIEGED